MKSLSTNIKLLIAAIVLIGIYFLTQRSSSTTEVYPDFTALDSASINKIEIAKNGNLIVLEKSANNWKTDNYNCDLNAVSTLITTIKNIKVNRLVSEKKEKHADFQVDDKTGTLVIIHEGSKQSKFYVGKEGASFESLLVRKDGEDGVFSTTTNFKYNLNKEQKEWKDKTIFKAESKDIATVILKQTKANLYITNMDSINFVRGENSKKEPEALGDYAVNSIFSTLAGLTANDFFTDELLPSLKLSVSAQFTMRNGESHQLAVYSKDADTQNMYIKFDANPILFAVAKYSFDNFSKSYKDLIKK